MYSAQDEKLSTQPIDCQENDHVPTDHPYFRHAYHLLHQIQLYTDQIPPIHSLGRAEFLRLSQVSLKRHVITDMRGPKFGRKIQLQGAQGTNLSEESLVGVPKLGVKNEAAGKGKYAKHGQLIIKKTITREPITSTYFYTLSSTSPKYSRT